MTGFAFVKDGKVGYVGRENIADSSDRYRHLIGSTGGRIPLNLGNQIEDSCQYDSQTRGQTKPLSLAANYSSRTHIIMRAVIGILAQRTIGWDEVEIEECFSTLAQTSIPVDHGKCPEAECADSDSAIKVDVGSRSICM